MSIQSTINQGLSLASLLISQNPKLKAMGEQRGALRKLDKEEKVLLGQLNQLTPAEKVTASGEVTEIGDELEITEKLSDIAKKRFETKPSEDTYAAYLDAKYKRAADYDSPEKAKGRQFLREVSMMSAKRAEAETKAQEASRLEAERLSKSRAFAKMVMEGTIPEYGVREGTKTTVKGDK